MLNHQNELQTIYKSQFETLIQDWSLLSFKVKPTKEEFLSRFSPEDMQSISFKTMNASYEKMHFPESIFFKTLSGEEEVILVDCEVSVINGIAVNQTIREVGSAPKLHQLFTAIKQCGEFEEALNPSGNEVSKLKSQNMYVDYKEIFDTQLHIKHGVIILIFG